MTIGVTGAAGGVGSRVVRDLLARGDVGPVVALVRRTPALPEVDRLTVRHADYDDPSSLRAAFAGLRTLVFISSDDLAESMRRHHEHVIRAAVDSGVEHVVYTSIVDVSPASPFYYAPVHRDTEAMLAGSGLGHALARTSIFADFLVSTWIAPALVHGTLRIPAAAGGMSLLSRDDAARALAAAAVERLRGVVELTGPAALTAAEVSRITEAATGRGLRYAAIDDEAYRRRLAADGTPDWLIEAFASMFAAVREGRFERVSADGRRLVGEAPRPFAEFMRVAGLSISTSAVRLRGDHPEQEEA